LIDLQINGAYGFDFTANSVTVADVSRACPKPASRRFFQPSSPPARKLSSHFARFEKPAKDARGAEILGVHLEGPYLNPQRVGAHNPNYLRAPLLASVQHFVPFACSPAVRMVTLAPELIGATELIRQLRSPWTVISAGHSAATYDQAVAGFNAGITYGTHLFNAMSSLAHREPGLVGALLSSDVPCGLIVDGVHVHPAAIKAAFRAKGVNGITLVTDAMAAMGTDKGHYTLGDRAVVVDMNSALADGTLAGSILQMDAAVRNMIEFTGCSLADAITMASSTRARPGFGTQRQNRFGLRRRPGRLR
jgi:N-acetylglucosamine-6-phosphate deacetylase